MKTNPPPGPPMLGVDPVGFIDRHLNAAQEGLNRAADLVEKSNSQLDHSNAPLITAIATLAIGHATTASAMMQALEMKR